MGVLGLNVEWLGHDCFRIRTKTQIIYFDPFQVDTHEGGDLIFITHEHYDHCSMPDLSKILKRTTTIVAANECKAKLRNLEGKVGRIIYIVPGQSIAVNEIEVQAVPAYNTNKYRSPGQVFHPRADGKVGYVVKIEGKKIYHAGDSDFIPEMRTLGEIDIAFLPVSGTYVMTVEEAAQAAEAIKPKVAIPMHYGAIVGTKDDAYKFKELARGINVAIL